MARMGEAQVSQVLTREGRRQTRAKGQLSLTTRSSSTLFVLTLKNTSASPFFALTLRNSSLAQYGSMAATPLLRFRMSMGSGRRDEPCFVAAGRRAGGHGCRQLV